MTEKVNVREGDERDRTQGKRKPFTSRLTVKLPSQVGQQRLGVLQVGGVKTLHEPAVDRREQLACFGALALVQAQATQAHGGAQLPGFGLLAAGYGESLLEAGFGLGHIRGGLA